MRSAIFHEHGPASSIQVVDVPVPEIGEDECLVEMRAVSLNGFDPQIVQGTTELKTPLPMVPCGDGAGVVVETGLGVGGAVSVGDRVSLAPFVHGRGMMGETILGTCREYVAVPATNLVPIPDNVSFVEAAALPIAYATALHMLRTRGRVVAGEKVLVLGATGGVGTCAVQLAASAGAEVIACGSAEWKLDRLRKLGADHVVDSSRADWVDAVRQIAGRPRVIGDGGGVNVVVNFVGGETWAAALRTLARHGRVLVCGASAGAQPQTDLRYIWSFEHTIVGSNGWEDDDHRGVLQMVSDGRLAPVIHAVRPMDEIAASVQELADRLVFGKTVLVMNGEAAG
jgi:alcohol dehydrogenase